ncbi:MAG: heme-binding protein [Chloroflexota bacterium]
MRQTKVLSHKDAMVIIDAVRSSLEARDAGAAVAVSDEHGELIALLRTDGCPLASINNAINKAYTAARERIPSGELGRRSREDGFPMTNFADLRYIGWGGGLPLETDGVIVGAVGVSGLPEAIDIEVATLGVEAWKATIG